MSPRRMLRLAAIVAGALVALVAIALLALPWIARPLTVYALSKATGRAVAVDALDLRLWGGRLAVRGLRVTDRDGGALLAVDRVDARFSPGRLIGGHLHLFDATIQAPTLRIVRTGPGTFNVSDLLGSRSEGGGKTPSMTVERFDFVGGAIAIEDRTLTPPRSWRVEALEIHARGVSSVAGRPPGGATLTAVAAGAPISLSVSDLRLAPLHLRAVLSVKDLDASLAALYLPPASPLTPTRGAVSVSATLDHDAARGALVTLEAGFTGVELHRPGQASPYLSAPSVKVTVDGLRARPGDIELKRLVVDAGAIGLEDTRLTPVRRWQIDGVVAEASGLSSSREAPPGIATARAATSGARVEIWVTNARLAPLELQATTIVRNVDLSLFRLYVPPSLPMRPERGVVNATLRLDHGRQGTRLALDAGLSDIELRRPTHHVTAPALRVRIEDVALDHGAVAVGHASLTSDRLTLEDRSAKAARTWPVQNLVVEAKDLSSRREAVQGVASLRATVAGASASVFVTGARLAPLELRATAVLRNVDAALLRFYVPDAVPVQLARGIVNATISVEHAEAAGTRLTGDATMTGLQAQGRAAFATLSVTSPSLRFTIADGRREGTDLRVGRVELSGSGLFTDSRGPTARYDLTELRIATEDLTWPVKAPAKVEVSMRFRDRGELDGSGTARLTAPLPTIAWASELDLKLRAVDLAPLAAYIPAAGGLGGRTRARVTVDLTYAGALTARVRGDVGGARFALSDGARTLLSLRSINAIGLDLEWPNRMTVKQLRLRQPYVFIERDRQMKFPLLSRFATPAAAAEASGAPGVVAPPPDPTATAPRPGRMAVTLEEVVVESGTATVLDYVGASPVRFEIPRVELTARRVTYPSAGPAQLNLEATLPAGGTLKVDGSLAASPMSVDLAIALKDADLAWLHPFLGFRARVGARLSANLTVAGPLEPAPRLKIAGDAGIRAVSISDGDRSVLTSDRLRITGIDALWPERLTIGSVRSRRTWALIERDAQGQFLLRTLLERPGAGAPRGAPAPPALAPRSTASPPPAPAAPATPSAPALEFTLREGVFEEQAATIVDGTTTPPARIEVAGARLTVRDLTWPSRVPAKVTVSSPMPAGGRVDLTGTFQLEPMRLEGRAVLDAVAIEPAQPYLPIGGRVAGKVTGDVTVKVALEPTSVQVTGQARLQRFSLSDGDRAVVSVGRIDTAGIDVDWPKRIALERVLLRRPRLLIEREEEGIRLGRLVTPHWTTGAAPDGNPADRAPAGRSETRATARPPAKAAAPPTIEVASFSLERASARFVDHTVRPTYAEELENVDVTLSPLTTAPGRRTRFTASGVVGGGTLKLQGEGTEGEGRVFDLTLELRNFIVPRANPYLDQYTAWTATNGSLDVRGTYKLDGNQLETRHDVLVRGLQVEPVDERDEVERRIGLPFGLLVSLLKDSRGEIKLSLPVSGDVSTREFDYREAMWGSVRNLSIRLLALPFSKVGSLFFSQDSKVKAVALGPAVFEAGTDRLGPEMGPHLDKVAAFLREAPALKVVLDSIVIDSDLRALRRAQTLAHLAPPAGSPDGDGALERARREYRGRWPAKPLPPTLEAIVAELATAETLPPDATRTLASRRIEVVREGLARGGVDVARLRGSASRNPLIEATGTPRVEFDLRP